MSAQLLPMPQPLSIEEIVRAQSTEYLITGSFDEVCEAIADRFKQYHPYGYSTRVTAIEFVSGNIFTARMTRANSCE